MPGLALELGRAVEPRLPRDDDVAQRHAFANAATCSCGDEYLGLDRRDNFLNELKEGRGGAVIVEVQPRLKKQHARLPDFARKVEAQAVVIAFHVVGSVVK